MSLFKHKRATHFLDDELFHRLSAELERRLPARLHDNFDALIPALRSLPRGLRAMAATHRLDVSMALSDLGWHFYNFHNRDLCDETQNGLLELEAIEAAAVFEAARALAEPHWNEIGSLSPKGPKVFAIWYCSSGLEPMLNPLNRQLWAICGRSPYGLLQYWLDYSRKYPDRLA